ncbi:hypothetical protein C7B61_06295 [filamentous cyanobacterium CCP1]|nr:hypothetical protein C7B76_12565 [filamentous cyanobacterium CCP2]PSB67415.1 hypothetical protein C7B61_06295 [filamentous cyanobacterium CCP1]
MLDSYWDRNDSNMHKLIINALGGILTADDSPLVRFAAAEALGSAYDMEDWQEASPQRREVLEKMRFLLYGNGETGQYGVLTSANWWLKEDCVVQTRRAQSLEAEELCQIGLSATKEAIRKNWENLEGVHLGETDLANAKLYEARLARAALWKANLSEANLARADLTQANLTGANLTGANLTGANLTGANLTGANLTGAKYNRLTKWTEGFDPITRGALEVAN